MSSAPGWDRARRRKSALGPEIQDPLQPARRRGPLPTAVSGAAPRHGCTCGRDRACQQSLLDRCSRARPSGSRLPPGEPTSDPARRHRAPGLGSLFPDIHSRKFCFLRSHGGCTFRVCSTPAASRHDVSPSPRSARVRATGPGPAVAAACARASPVAGGTGPGADPGPRRVTRAPCARPLPLRRRVTDAAARVRSHPSVSSGEPPCEAIPATAPKPPHASSRWP